MGVCDWEPMLPFLYVVGVLYSWSPDNSQAPHGSRPILSHSVQGGRGWPQRLGICLLAWGSYLYRVEWGKLQVQGCSWKQWRSQWQEALEGQLLFDISKGTQVGSSMRNLTEIWRARWLKRKPLWSHSCLVAQGGACMCKITPVQEQRGAASC